MRRVRSPRCSCLPAPFGALGAAHGAAAAAHSAPRPGGGTGGRFGRVPANHRTIATLLNKNKNTLQTLSPLYVYIFVFYTRYLPGFLFCIYSCIYTGPPVETPGRRATHTRTRRTAGSAPNKKHLGPVEEVHRQIQIQISPPIRQTPKEHNCLHCLSSWTPFCRIFILMPVCFSARVDCNSDIAIQDFDSVYPRRSHASESEPALDSSST